MHTDLPPPNGQRLGRPRRRWQRLVSAADSRRLGVAVALRSFWLTSFWQRVGGSNTVSQAPISTIKSGTV